MVFPKHLCVPRYPFNDGIIDGQIGYTYHADDSEDFPSPPCPIKRLESIDFSINEMDRFLSQTSKTQDSPHCYYYGSIYDTSAKSSKKTIQPTSHQGFLPLLASKDPLMSMPLISIPGDHFDTLLKPTIEEPQDLQQRPQFQLETYNPRKLSYPSGDTKAPFNLMVPAADNGATPMLSPGRASRPVAVSPEPKEKSNNILDENIKWPPVILDANDRFQKFQCQIWMLKYEDCVAFEREHGHCVIPSKYPPNRTLALWAKRQRYNYQLYKNKNATKRKGKGYRGSSLTPDRIKLLDDIGFCWEHKQQTWNLRYETLLEFKKEYGHTMVPSNFLYKGSTQLATWVKTQRTQFSRRMKGEGGHHMANERIELLNQIEFVWKAHHGRSLSMISNRVPVVPPQPSPVGK